MRKADTEAVGKADMMPLQNDHSRSRKIAYIAVLTAVAAITGYLEQLIPVNFFGIPGVKLGLANIVSLIALYVFDARYAFIIMVARVILIGAMFGNMYAILFGLAGGTLSILIMTALKRTGLFGIAGISAAGGVSHNIGQLIVAMLTLDGLNLIYYVPLLVVSGTICGFITGIIAGIICDRIIDIRFNESVG